MSSFTPCLKQGPKWNGCGVDQQRKACTWRDVLHQHSHMWLCPGESFVLTPAAWIQVGSCCSDGVRRQGLGPESQGGRCHHRPRLPLQPSWEPRPEKFILLTKWHLLTLPVETDGNDFIPNKPCSLWTSRNHLITPLKWWDLQKRQNTYAVPDSYSFMEDLCLADGASQFPGLLAGEGTLWNKEVTSAPAFECITTRCQAPHLLPWAHHCKTTGWPI